MPTRGGLIQPFIHPIHVIHNTALYFLSRPIPPYVCLRLKTVPRSTNVLACKNPIKLKIEVGDSLLPEDH
jgi:hypothetical protein